MNFKVERYEVPEKRPRNRYPIDRVREIGDGFTIKKAYRPKGRLSSVGLHQGKRFSQTTLKNGDLRLVLVELVKRPARKV